MEWEYVCVLENPIIHYFEITYKIKFIDNYRFMSSSFSKLVDNLSEGNF